MQMPDKWEDPYVFVEDFYAHFAGKRRMAMCDAVQTMTRLFELDFAFVCPGIRIGRRGKVSYQTLRAWLEAAGDEDDLLHVLACEPSTTCFHMIRQCCRGGSRSGLPRARTPRSISLSAGLRSSPISRQARSAVKGFASAPTLSPICMRLSGCAKGCRVLKQPFSPGLSLTCPRLTSWSNRG